MGTFRSGQNCTHPKPQCGGRKAKKDFLHEFFFLRPFVAKCHSCGHLHITGPALEKNTLKYPNAINWTAKKNYKKKSNNLSHFFPTPPRTVSPTAFCQPKKMLPSGGSTPSDGPDGGVRRTHRLAESRSPADTGP